jgi:hypothetical protein
MPRPSPRAPVSFFGESDDDDSDAPPAYRASPGPNAPGGASGSRSSVDDVIPRRSSSSSHHHPLRRYFKWPYYCPPPGWVTHPAWDLHVRAPDWTAFVPPESAAFGVAGWFPSALPPPPLPVHPYPAAVRRGTYPQYHSHPSPLAPPVPTAPSLPNELVSTSPFLARSLPERARDHQFYSYRRAQRHAREC